MPQDTDKPNENALDLTELVGEDEIKAALAGEDLADDAANGQPAQSASGSAGAQAQGKAKPKGKAAKGKPQGKAKRGASKRKAQAKQNKGASAAEAIANAVSVVAPEAGTRSAPEDWEREVPEDRLGVIERPGGQIYRPRPVSGMTDVELLQKARDAGIPVLLAGFPGTGKTALVEAAFNGEVITMNGNADMEKADFMGSYVFRASEPGAAPEPVWVDGPLVRAMKEGKVLFVDDTTLIPANVISVLYPLMDGRNRIVLTDHESEEIVAKEGFYVCGAHNPGAPGAMLAEALSSRFGIQMTVDTDLVMAEQHFAVPVEVIGVAAEMRTLRAKGEVSWAPEMRELLAFKRNAEVFGMRVAVNNLIGVAPEDARDELQKRLATWFPKAEPLRHDS